MDIEKLLQEISAQIDPFLEECIIYYSTPINQKHGTSGGMLFRIINGKNDYNVCKDIDDKLRDVKIEGVWNPMYEATKTFKENSRIKYIFQKGKPIQIEVYTTEMILEDFENEVRNEYNDNKLLKIEANIQFLIRDKKLKLSGQKAETNADSSIENFDKIYDENLELLYYSLDEKIQKLNYIYENGSLAMSGKPSFPDYNIHELNETANLELDETNINAIFAFLESMNEQKIAKAVEVIKTNPKLKARAEARYLNLIRTRLQNPEAELEQLADVRVISDLDVSLMLGKDIAKNFLSFGNMDNAQTCFIVDYLGSMVRNAFNCNALIEEMQSIKPTDGEKEIAKIYKKYAKKLHDWHKKESESFSDGWFGKINAKLFAMTFEKVLFDHTRFSSANKSLVMNEFMFFLNNNSKPATPTLFIDIFQSDCPQFGPMFWLLPTVPKTLWGDVTPKFPVSVLGFERTSIYKVSDDGKWETIVSKTSN